MLCFLHDDDNDEFHSRAALNDKLTIQIFICLLIVPEQHQMTNNVFCSYSMVFMHLNGFWHHKSQHLLVLWMVLAIINSLTAMDLDLHPLFLGLRNFVITSQIFVLKASWRHQNVAEVVSYNCGISHLHSACRINDIFRFPFRVTKITTFTGKKVW